jgi:hypothetical protein
MKKESHRLRTLSDWLGRLGAKSVGTLQVPHYIEWLNCGCCRPSENASRKEQRRGLRVTRASALSPWACGACKRSPFDGRVIDSSLSAAVASSTADMRVESGVLAVATP